MDASKSTVRLLLDDPQYLAKLIVEGEVESLVIDNAYLLVYAIVKPWYSKSHYVVSEELVLRIGKGSNFSAVVGVLEDLADHHEASGIIVGGALARHSRALIRMYERHGFQLETSTPSLTKLRR